MKINEDYENLFTRMLGIQAEYLAEEIELEKKRRVEAGEDEDKVNEEFKKYEYIEDEEQGRKNYEEINEELNRSNYEKTKEEHEEDSRESLIIIAKEKLKAFRKYISGVKLDRDIKERVKLDRRKRRIFKSVFIGTYLDKIAKALGITVVVSCNCIIHALKFLTNVINSLVALARDTILKILAIFRKPESQLEQ